MNFRTLTLCLLTAALGMSSCKSQYELLLASNDIDAKYEEAFRLYDLKKYKKAASMFESLSMLTQGMAQDDTVRYYWALSNYKYKDYTTAEANFGSFVDMYAASPFTSDARFLKLDCMFRSTYRYELDQNPTRMCIMSISEYLIEFPATDKVEPCQKMLKELNDRLDTKAFEAARLYYKMEDYIAARTAFKNILKDNADNIYREQILYYIAKSEYKYAQHSVASKQKERYMEFVDAYLNFVGEVPESAYRKEMDQLYAKAQQVIEGRKLKERESGSRDEKKADKKMNRTMDKATKKI